MSEMHDQQTCDLSLMNSAHAADCQNVDAKDPLYTVFPFSGSQTKGKLNPL